MCFKQAKWIWGGDSFQKNSRVLFRKNFTVETLPESALLNIAADTKYYLYVNGELVVYDGALFRESTKENGWYDRVELAPYLHKGENLIALLVWYFGNGGRNNSDSGQAGLIFECETLSLYSDHSTGALPDPAAYETTEENPSYIYGGHNYASDGRKTLLGWELPGYTGAAFPPRAGKRRLPLPAMEPVPRAVHSYVCIFPHCGIKIH